MRPLIVVLGTGGTIAGLAVPGDDGPGYAAAQVGVAQLLRTLPALRELPIECEQLAQIDSKDMDYALWQLLAQRVALHLARPEVQGIVVTHGTDTVEETAYLLQRVLAPDKPVVLAAAMRPANALQADGPQNLCDAVAVASEPGARGVCVAVGGVVHTGIGVRKAHTWRLDAFDSGDAGPLARIQGGTLRRFREWPVGRPLGLGRIQRPPARWPRVEIVLNHVGADGFVVRALLAQGVAGLVVAGTGSGTVSQALEQALRDAQTAGVRVRRSTRCAAGPVFAPGRPGDAPSDLTAVQARVELLLELLDAAE